MSDEEDKKELEKRTKSLVLMNQEWDGIQKRVMEIFSSGKLEQDPMKIHERGYLLGKAHNTYEIFSNQIKICQQLQGDPQRDKEHKLLFTLSWAALERALHLIRSLEAHMVKETQSKLEVGKA